MRYMCAHETWFSSTARSSGPPEHQVADVEAVDRHHGAEDLEQHEVAGQDADECAERDHQEREDEGRRDHPGRAAHAVEIGSVRQPPRASPSMSAKSLVVDAPSRNSPKIAPMYQGSRPNTVFTARPAGDLQQHAARDRDRHVRPDAVPLGAQRRHRIEYGATMATSDDPEAFVPAARRDQPRQHERDRVGDDVNIHASRRESRPLVSGRFGLLTRSMSRS